jgi:predicted small metal-binding protein
VQETAQARWSVTCECGWRVHGTREEVIAAVMEHGREVHGLSLSEKQAMDRAIQLQD